MSRTTRLIVIGGLVLVTAALTVVFASRFGSDPRLSPSPLIGSPAPDPLLRGIEGGSDLHISDLRGDIVVVNFWAPWCVPCREEHGDLLEVAQGYDDLGVTVLGIVYESELRDVIAFLDELGRGYPVVMDDRSRAAIEFGLRGVPETYFVDRDGLVVGKVSGAITLELAVATLDRMILGLDPAEE